MPVLQQILLDENLKFLRVYSPFKLTCYCVQKVEIIELVSYQCVQQFSIRVGEIFLLSQFFKNFQKYTFLLLFILIQGKFLKNIILSFFCLKFFFRDKVGCLIDRSKQILSSLRYGHRFYE